MASGAFPASALVAAAALAGVYVWLHGYAPLRSAPLPGGAGGAAVAPKGSAPFYTSFTLRNTGRFAVTVTGLGGESGGPLAPSALLGTDSPAASTDPAHLHPFVDLRLDPGDTAILVVRWRHECAAAPAGASASGVRLRYRYLSIFSRSATVALPAAVSLRC